MTETAEIVIIGGGIVGASIAFHLTEAGLKDVLVIERGAAQGMGSTGKATGGVRAQFSTSINIRMSLYSIEFFARFKEWTGVDCGYRADGYLFLATRQEHLDYLRATRDAQRAAGFEGVEILRATEIAAMIPQLCTDDVVGGSFCQTDGPVDPLAAMKGLTNSACAKGARVWLGTEATAIEIQNGAVAGVETTRGFIATRAVVNAAGAWAAEIGRLAGVEIPVVPLRRQLVATRSFDGLASRLPIVIDMTDGFHFKRDPKAGDPPGVLLGWSSGAESLGFDTTFDFDFARRTIDRAVLRVPCLREVELDPQLSRAGLYEMTPDHHAIIGPVPGVSGLFLATGFSGHGVMHAPATGRLVSELILDGEARLLDIYPLRLERFAEGALLTEPLSL